MLCTHAFPLQLLRTGSPARARDSAVCAQMHFVSLCTEVDFSPGSSQFECALLPIVAPTRIATVVLPSKCNALLTCEVWVETESSGWWRRFLLTDLSLVNRSITPWLVVNLHRPIYTSSASGLSFTSVLKVAQDLRLALEDLFFLYQVRSLAMRAVKLFEYVGALCVACLLAGLAGSHNLRQARDNPAAQVDVTFSGHDHKYERTCPVYKKRCLDLDANSSATAPVHVVIGNAGYKLSWGYNPHMPPYWEAMALEHGYLRCEANKTSFRCEASACCFFTRRCCAARFVSESCSGQPRAVMCSTHVVIAGNLRCRK